MDNRSEVRDFLVTRRARLRPADASLPDDGTLRRVPGLRRGEDADLAGVSIGARPRRPSRIRPEVQATLDAFTGGPAFVRNGRLDVLVANDTVAILRTEAGRDPHDKDLSGLVGEFSTRSHEFRIRWAAHNVKQQGLSLLVYTPPSRAPEPTRRCAYWPAGLRRRTDHRDTYRRGDARHGDRDLLS